MFLLVGLLLTAFGIVGYHNGRRLVRTSQRATAEVVDLEWWSSSGKVVDPERGAYYPVVTFRTADGQMVRARTRTGRIPPSAHVGEQVRVTYDPRDPRIVAIDSPSGRGTMLSGFVAIVGVGVIAFQVYRMLR